MSLVTFAPRGYVDGDGWARHADGTPIATSDGCGHLSLHTNATHQHKGTVRVQQSLGTALSKYSYKFFHWLVEGLPRVALLLEAWQKAERAERRYLTVRGMLSSSLVSRAHAHDAPRLLVSCRYPVVRESLALLGIERSRIICFKPGRHYHTSRTLYWPAAAPCGGARADAARALRAFALLPHLRPASSSSASKLEAAAVIVHQRLQQRRLLNHDALLLALRQSPSVGGPHMRVLRGDGNLSLREQVELFRGARCQIGPHGAGMALMLFAPSPSFGTVEVAPGAYFVAIRGKPGDHATDVASGLSLHLNRGRNRTSKWISHTAPNACYRGLAATLGMRHEWQLIPGATANEDLAADVGTLIAMAERMCSGA